MQVDGVTVRSIIERTLDLLTAQWEFLAAYILGMGALGVVLDLVGIENTTVYNIASMVALYFLMRRMLTGAGVHLTSENRFWPYIGVAILSAFGIFAGVLLLIVPGLVLFVRWLPAYGVLLAENTGVTAALGISWQRTRPAFWPLLAVALMYIVSLVVVIGGFALLAENPGVPLLAWSIPLNLAAAALSTGSVALGLAAYLLLDPQAVDTVADTFA